MSKILVRRKDGVGGISANLAPCLGVLFVARELLDLTHRALLPGELLQVGLE